MRATVTRECGRRSILTRHVISTIGKLEFDVDAIFDHKDDFGRDSEVGARGGS
jgi:hypothetical protein